MESRVGWWARARKLVHWATGDRTSEAGALADEAEHAGSPVRVETAEHEVQRAHGDLGAGTKGAAEPDVPDVRAVTGDE
jgi:hypothetical protein